MMARTISTSTNPIGYWVSFEDGALPKAHADLLEEIEQLDRQCDGTILALTEALVLNIRYTHVEE